MIEWVLKKIIGTKNDRELKKTWPKVARVNELETKMRALKDEDFPRGHRPAQGRGAKGRSLDDVLFEAFALTREACRAGAGPAALRRAAHRRHVPAPGLHRRDAHRRRQDAHRHPALLPERALGPGRARRHGERLPGPPRRGVDGPGLQLPGDDDGLHRCTSSPTRSGRTPTAADITYGQNNEFGFDYLRDNMKFRLQDYVQRELNFAIVDEVDSILIDEARTPLIISGPTDDNTELYGKVDQVIYGLIPEQDYQLDEKNRSVIADRRRASSKLQQRLKIANLYAPEELETLHHVEQALRAHTLYKRDRDYVVKEGEVLIVDEFTGRLMPGPPLERRPAPGHRGQGRREGREREPDPGHHLVPELLPHVHEALRHDRHRRHRGRGVREDLQPRRARGAHQQARWSARTSTTSSTRPRRRSSTRPPRSSRQLTPRASRCWSARCRSTSREVVSKFLKAKGVPHEVLNAKNHAREADIIAQAGRKGAVTISTNMAGRGTDILLGGNPEVLAKKASGPRARRGRVHWQITMADEAAARSVRRAARPAGRRKYERRSAKFKAQCEAEREEVRRAGRPLHPRHRAPRVAPHRQPAARPRRPPGRPRRAAASTCRSKTT